MKKQNYGHFLMFYQGFQVYLPDKESLLESLVIRKLIAVKDGRVITATGAESLKIKMQLELYDDKKARPDS